MKIGIVGLPNVGKSTLFNALTKAGALCENYPFTTIQPNVGIAVIPDDRLEKIAEIYQSKTKIPTTVEFVDIAGLVKGASKGEGLGNQFLSHIRQVDAVAHVLRSFENDQVTHVYGQINPIEDSQIVQTELILSDLEMATKNFAKYEKLVRAHDLEAEKKYVFFKKAIEVLEKGQSILSLPLTEEELKTVQEVGFLTFKPVMYILNTDEKNITQCETIKKNMKEKLGSNTAVVPICAKIEDELNELSYDEAKEFIKDLGIAERGLHQVIKEGYKLLGLITFFTTESSQTRGWTVTQGTKAPQAAGKIHTDMEKGFIKAEVISYNDLEHLGSTHKVKEAGLLRLEGKEYIVQDGDIILFRFSV